MFKNKFETIMLINISKYLEFIVKISDFVKWLSLTFPFFKGLCERWCSLAWLWLGSHVHQPSFLHHHCSSNLESCRYHQANILSHFCGCLWNFGCASAISTQWYIAFVNYSIKLICVCQKGQMNLFNNQKRGKSQEIIYHNIQQKLNTYVNRVYCNKYYKWII